MDETEPGMMMKNLWQLYSTYEFNNSTQAPAAAAKTTRTKTMKRNERKLIKGRAKAL